MATTKTRTGKPVIKADTACKSPLIPELTKDKNDIILGLLSSLLEPIGRHQAAHAPKSSGKKSRKRKRTSEQYEVSPAESKPSKPEVLKFLTVGLNSTSRHLEVEAALSKPGSLPSAEAAPKSAEQEPPSKHLAVVFLSKPRDNLVYAHLPLLCYTASAAQKDKAQSTRLVMLDPSCERKIAACMGLPRAGVVGVFDDAPGTASLMDYIRENVGPVEVPWMESALSGKWLGTNVEHRVPGQA